MMTTDEELREKVDSLEQKELYSRARAGTHEMRFARIELAHRLLRDKKWWWQVWKR